MSLLPELDQVVQSGSPERLAGALRGVTGLFVAQAERLTGEQIAVFGDVLVMLASALDSSARSELSQRLAPIAEAPFAVIRRLAGDDDIAVARPVLTESTRLGDADLAEIARKAGTAHLLAMAGRHAITEALSDVLVLRGDFTVKCKLAGNPGAALSEVALTALVRSARFDSALAERLASRRDLPDGLFRELMSQASESVQHRLRAKAEPAAQAEAPRPTNREPLADVTPARAASDFSKAEETVRAHVEAGTLDEERLLKFAEQSAYDETVAALAQLSGVPIEVVDRLMRGQPVDPILILCKAAGHSWPTVRAIILARRNGQGSNTPGIDQASGNFDRLSAATAKRVVQFWQVSPGSLRNAS